MISVDNAHTTLLALETESADDLTKNDERGLSKTLFTLARPCYLVTLVSSCHEAPREVCSWFLVTFG